MHKRVLCLDFGNTLCKGAILEGDHIINETIFNPCSVESIQDFYIKNEVTSAILSSVINHPLEIDNFLNNTNSFHLLSASSKLNFTTPIGKPNTIGADRIALISYARAHFPTKHNLIIALGTCITYNFMNRDGEFLGGGISPGLKLRFKSLKEYTALLPLVEPDHNFPLIGYNTETNILSAVMLGIKFELDGIIEQYQQKFTNLNILLTGGDSEFLADRLKCKIFADKNMLFKGLKIVHDQNIAS